MKYILRDICSSLYKKYRYLISFWFVESPSISQVVPYCDEPIEYRVNIQTRSKNTQRYYRPKRLISYRLPKCYDVFQFLVLLKYAWKRSQSVKQVFFAENQLFNQLYNIVRYLNSNRLLLLLFQMQLVNMIGYKLVFSHLS